MTFQSPLLLLVLLAASSHGKTWLEPSAASLLNKVTFGYEPSVMVKGSNVICTENGVFPILDSCEDYYHCTDWDGRGMQIYHFTCPQGTIFEDQFDNCHSPTVGITRPGCENVTYDVSFAIEDSYSVPFIKRHKRSLPPQENCTNEYPDIFAEIIAESAKDTCSLIYHVDKYVRLVRAMVPVILPEYVDGVYTTIVEQYNECLEIAQNHSYTWRHGNDIMSGIRRTYELAQIFAPEFERKHQIMQKRIDELKATSVDTVMRSDNLKSEIKRLKSKKERIGRMISLNAEDKDIRMYFFNESMSIDEEIERKEMELNELDVPVVKTLKELVYFMELVKDDAGRIEAKANSTRAKLKIFKDHVSQDKEDFDRSMQMANKGILQLELDRNGSLALITESKAKIEEEEIKRNKEREVLRQLGDVMDKIIDSLGKNLTNIQNRILEQHKKDLDGQGFFSWLFGMDPTSDATILLRKQKKTYEDIFSLKKEHYDSRVKAIDEEVARYRTKIRQEESKLEIKSEKLHMLSFVDNYLEFVIDDADGILLFITKALVSLELIEDIFDDIVYDLEDLITRAKRAKTGVERKGIEHVIYVDLSTMKHKWNASNANIISLGRCTRGDYFHILIQEPEPTTTTTEIPIISTEIVDPTLNDTLIMDLLTPTGNSSQDIDDDTVGNSTEDTDWYTLGNSIYDYYL